MEQGIFGPLGSLYGGKHGYQSKSHTLPLGIKKLALVWFFFLFIYSFLLPYFFHWLLKREEKIPAPTDPNEQCSFLLQGAWGSLDFYMPKKWLKQSASDCDIHLCWQCDFLNLSSNALSQSMQTGKASAARASVCSPTHFLPLLFLRLSLDFGLCPWLRLRSIGTEAQG